MSVVAAVFARGGSRGVPRKNLRTVGGVTLLARAIDVARRAPSVDAVIVSTDDEEIAGAALAAGAEVPFLRPAELSGDDAPELLAWQHAIRELQAAGRPIDLLVSLPPTAPLRTVDDVEASIAEARASGADLVLSVTPARRHPSFNMVQVGIDGVARLAVEGGVIHRRQEAPALFDITTVAYVARPEFVLRARGLFDGVVRTVTVPVWRSIDIDDELDLVVAEAILRDGRGR